MRNIVKIFAILYVRYLQKKYKRISIDNIHNRTNQVLSKLQLIQSKLYYYKSEFSSWGYFHPDGVWSKKDEKFFRKLFPEKEDFKELDIVVWYNPAAVIYYKNKIYALTNGNPPNFSIEIEEQLRKWKDWN